jgi:hypothetical protein
MHGSALSHTHFLTLSPSPNPPNPPKTLPYCVCCCQQCGVLFGVEGGGGGGGGGEKTRGAGAPGGEPREETRRRGVTGERAARLPALPWSASQQQPFWGAGEGHGARRRDSVGAAVGLGKRGPFLNACTAFCLPQQCCGALTHTHKAQNGSPPRGPG